MPTVDRASHGADLADPLALAQGTWTGAGVPERRALHLTIPLAPIPKARPRMMHGGHAYMPARYRTWIDEARYEITRLWDVGPIQGPLDVRIRMFGPKRPRGDLDNLCGAVWDACNELVWADDSQIEGMSCHFGAAEAWRIEVTIYPLDPLTYPKPSRARKAAKP